jgi:hypothetical protein
MLTSSLLGLRINITYYIKIGAVVEGAGQVRGRNSEFLILPFFSDPPYHNFKEIELKNNLGRGNYGKGVIFNPFGVNSPKLASIKSTSS